MPEECARVGYTDTHAQTLRWREGEGKREREREGGRRF